MDGSTLLEQMALPAGIPAILQPPREPWLLHSRVELPLVPASRLVALLSRCQHGVLGVLLLPLVPGCLLGPRGLASLARRLLAPAWESVEWVGANP